MARLLESDFWRAANIHCGLPQATSRQRPDGSGLAAPLSTLQVLKSSDGATTGDQRAAALQATKIGDRRKHSLN